jgi:ABC-type sugar transport system substrate-binding protein
MHPQGSNSNSSRLEEPSRRSVLRGLGLTAAGVAGVGLLGGCVSHASPAAAVEHTGSTDSGSDAGAVKFSIDTSKWPKGKTIGMLVAPPQYDIDKRMIDAAEAVAKQAGWKTLVVDITQSDPNAAAKGWVTQKVDAVATLFIPATYFAAGATALRAANIPIGGCVAGYTDALSFDVQGNEWAATGQLAAWALGRLGGVSPGPGGAIGNVAVLAVPGAQHQDIRVKVLQSMVSFCPGMKVVAQPGLNTSDLVGDSKAKTAALLNQYPKGKLQWIFAADSTFGVAAAQAIQAAGRQDDVFVTGCNGILQEFDGIRTGGPNKAATFLSVEYAAQVTMQEIANILGGAKPMAPTLYIDTPMITKDNVPASGKFPSVAAGLLECTDVNA